MGVSCAIRVLLIMTTLSGWTLAQIPLAEGAAITITPDVPFLVVPEDQGEAGVFTFTVKNVLSPEELFPRVVIRDVLLPIDPIEFKGGDRNDEVFQTAIVEGAGNTCETRDVILAPADVCQFRQLFLAGDFNKAQSDTNSGIWEISNKVEFFRRAGIVESAAGSALVEVLDPGASPTLPEPSTLLLLGSGLGVMAYRRLRRSKGAS